MLCSTMRRMTDAELDSAAARLEGLEREREALWATIGAQIVSYGECGAHIRGRVYELWALGPAILVRHRGTCPRRRQDPDPARGCGQPRGGAQR